MVVQDSSNGHTDMHTNQDICFDAAKHLLQNLARPSSVENTCNIMSEDPSALSHLEARIFKSLTRVHARCTSLENGAKGTLKMDEVTTPSMPLFRPIWIGSRPFQNSSEATRSMVGALRSGDGSGACIALLARTIQVPH